ncbi:MAG TPA: hypothetical protein VNJ01_04650 [Bacteriovoracaceae bacterium]|nr:hypothetical protein [Bacteriovoracaceae bacterium]
MKALTFIIAFFSFATLASANVLPGHVDGMLDQMVKENVISLEEAQKAKLRMKSLSPEQWKKINSEAKVAASRSPASAMTVSSNKIYEVNKIDLDGAQFKQIQDDMKKIMPEYKD